MSESEDMNALLPWTPGDHFDQAMIRIERNDPRGPVETITRRLTYWHAAQLAKVMWSLPDDPFDSSAWLLDSVSGDVADDMD